MEMASGSLGMFEDINGGDMFIHYASKERDTVSETVSTQELAQWICAAALAIGKKKTAKEAHIYARKLQSDSGTAWRWRSTHAQRGPRGEGVTKMACGIPHLIITEILAVCKEQSQLKTKVVLDLCSGLQSICKAVLEAGA